MAMMSEDTAKRLMAATYGGESDGATMDERWSKVLDIAELVPWCRGDLTCCAQDGSYCLCLCHHPVPWRFADGTLVKEE